MATKTRKGIYHSELDYKTRDEGGAWVQLDNTPTDSQNDKIAGFVSVTDWDGVTDRYINLENRAIRAAFEAAPTGAFLWVEAGGKGEEAWAVVKDQEKNVVADSRALMAAGAGGPPQGGPPAPPSGPPAGPPQGPPAQQQSAPPPPPQHQQNGNGARALSRTYFDGIIAATSMLDTLLAEGGSDNTGEMVDRLGLRDATPDGKLRFIQAAAASLVIQWHKDDGRIPMVANGNG